MATLETKTTELIAVQDAKITADYTQTKRTIDGNLDYEVYAYGNPKAGYYGYQIIFHEARKDGEYLKSTGYGPEAASRTYDWTKQDIN